MSKFTDLRGSPGTPNHYWSSITLRAKQLKTVNTLLYESFAFARQRAEKLKNDAGEARRRRLRLQIIIFRISKNLIFWTSVENTFAWLNL